MGLAALGLVLAAPAAGASEKLEADLKVQQARIAFLKFMDSPDAGTPRWLLKRCRGGGPVPGHDQGRLHRGEATTAPG